MDGNGQDPALFDQINNALIGELPSFGASKESKFQQLMRNNSMTNVDFGQDNGQDIRTYASFGHPADDDMSLCADAKEFKPMVPQATGHSFSSTLSSFESLNLSAPNGMNQNVPQPLQPNPTAREFVPRNQSAPNLHLSQMNAATPLSSSMAVPTIPGIKEFIPSSRLSQIGTRQNGGIQQHTNPFMSTQQPRFMSQGAMRAMGDQDMVGMTKSNSTMGDTLGGTHRTQPLEGVPTNGHGNVFSPPQPATFYAGGDSDNSLNHSPHPAKTRMNVSELKICLKKLEQDFQQVLKRQDCKLKRCMTESVPGYLPTTSSPYGRQSMLSNGSVGNMSRILGARSGSETSDRSSPLQARRAANHQPVHRSSPLEPLSADSRASMDAEMQAKVSQENFGGTTYFFTQGQKRQNMAVVVPQFNVFSGSPPNVEYMKQRAGAPSFFMSDELRRSIMKKQTMTMLTIDAEQNSSVPAEVDSYHSLFPLEEVSEDIQQQKSNTFGFVTSCYKAIKYKDGLPYCLRRIHGFRQVNQKCMVLVEMWKKIQHANIVILREVFTSKAFGEHCLLPESLIWTYIVQLTSALRCIHAAGLACRVLDPTKIMITDKSRIRINGLGIFDVLGFDSSHSNPRAHMPQYQQDDLVALGKVVLALACNTVAAIQRDSFPQSLELVVMNYSTDLKNFILYLLTPQQRPRSVNDIMPMIGARFYTQLDVSLMRGDVIENELAKVTETGAPWIDMAHIVQCLNKLDAGSPEKLCLMSRDEQNVLVVSYSDLKKAFEKCFGDLIASQR